MKSFKLEICTPNLQSVEAAVRGKANRIELCSALEVGGLTPSPSLIRAACRMIDTHVLLRPRAGHFRYSRSEFQTMQRDAQFARKAGAKGIVFGILNHKQMPNKYEMERIIQAAPDMEYTFHRAFDCCKEPLDAIEVLVNLGFTRILTSGRANSAMEGSEFLAKVQERANGRIAVMAGGGINPHNILDIQRATGCTEFHASATRRFEVEEEAIAGIEPSFLISDLGAIRDMRKALEYAV